MRSHAAAVALAAVVLTACTPYAPTPTSPPDLTPAWTTDVPTLGATATVDGVVVAYVSPADGELELHAWSLDRGEPLWHAEASPAGMAPGVALQPMVLEHDGVGYVAFIAPGDAGLHGIVLAAASDGVPVPFDGHDLDAWVAERPAPCADDEAEAPERACLAAMTTATGGEVQRLELDPGGLTVLPDAGATDHGRTIGPDLYATDDRGPGAERIEYVVDGELRWSVAYHDVFGPGYSSDNGWEWRRDDERGLMLGIASAGHEGDTLDLASTTTVALDLDDGGVVWRVEGFSLWCAVGSDTLDVGCDYDGTVVTYHSDVPGDATITDGTIAIARLDLDTGEPLWEVPVGDWLGASWDVDGLAHDDAAAIILQDGDPSLLDLDDGSLDRVAWAALPCTTSAYYDYQERTDEDAEPVPYLGGHVVFACDAARDPVALPAVPAAWVVLAGTSLGTHDDMHAQVDRWIVPTLDGLALYEVPST